MGNVVEQFRSVQLTQGALFTCATAEAYRGCEVHGLIITARCDAAHQKKAPVFNYIPVVRFEDWLKRDFVIISSERDRSQVEANLASTLVSASFSPSILLTQSPRSILEKLFALNEKSVKAAKPKFEKYVQQWETLESIQTPLEVPISTLSRYFRKTHDAVIKECIHQRLAGYYFLSATSPADRSREGYVALLREVHHIPVELARRIAEGMSASDYKIFCSYVEAASAKLDFSVHDFAMPTGLLRSPELEHLMQSFALLFTRIGVQDPDPSYIEQLSIKHLGQRGEKND